MPHNNRPLVHVCHASLCPALSHPQRKDWSSVFSSLGDTLSLYTQPDGGGAAAAAAGPGVRNRINSTLPSVVQVTVVTVEAHPCTPAPLRHCAPAPRPCAPATMQP